MFYRILIVIAIILISCKEKDNSKIDIFSKESNDSLAYHKEDVGFQENKDKIIYNDENIKIYANHSIIEEGEEKLIIHSNKKDTLLTFQHEDGGKITFPFVISYEDNIFINFFEVWEGSGFLSKKNFYHLNKNDYSLDSVAEIELKTILSDVKKMFEIKDSIYTKTGEFYKNYSFDKTCFNENGELPFTMILYNYDKPKLNKGLEGFKTMNGLYRFEKVEGYTLKPTKIELQD
ncbi:hypothetical protein [uncultured Aquimarina sp.]|uniref:hypothetical protein n=1 Tax=uncultured Aquimarina sp. TaxID=575652 RepID=UPI00261202AD|nr:hypothetical protein [uncultured Aquimarina sp.]